MKNNLFKNFNNIFCLCSNCHSKIHHINDKDKLNMILTLYSKKSEFYLNNDISKEDI